MVATLQLGDVIENCLSSILQIMTGGSGESLVEIYKSLGFSLPQKAILEFHPRRYAFGNQELGSMAKGENSICL